MLNRDEHIQESAIQGGRYKKGELAFAFFMLSVAEWTGLEPATPGVTGRYSNQLNYHSAVIKTL
jgi:hypothetical protein